MKLIQLSNGAYFPCDDEDFELLAPHTWALARRGRTAYACTKSNGRRLYAHRLILDAPSGVMVDHVDGCGLNNVRSNLRLATPSENQWNHVHKRRGTSSRFKGVWLHQRSARWIAEIGYEGGKLYLGCFVDEVEAARAYDAAARQLYGEYAHPNFPV